jgi:hypothetical protein
LQVVQTERVTRAGLLLAAVAAAAVLAAGVGGRASADTPAIVNSPDLPWTHPTHESELELLLGRIASTIAKKQVTVRCEGDTDWRKLVTERGGDPTAELGYVGVDFHPFTGQLRSLETFAELAGEAICLPLKRFAAANPKPTKCVAMKLEKRKVLVNRRVLVRKQEVVGGKRTVRHVFVVRRVPVVLTRTVNVGLRPCYLGTGRAVRDMPESYWKAYAQYSDAILTLTHEAFHLAGIIGGWRLRGGIIAGDPQAEAKATCYGMQWMRHAAVELGATPDDGQAIARFYWDNVYPEYRTSRHSQYWSPDCRPGGPLDQRAPGKTVWP